MMERNLKIRDYDTRIREQNKRRLMKRENHEITIGNTKRNLKNMRVLRATPVQQQRARPLRSSKPQRNQKRTKTLENRQSSTKELTDSKGKENRNNMNTQKKYEYGNPSVLLWMKKQRKLRALKEKEIEQKRKETMQKRKEYVDHLNRKQKERAKKVQNRLKMRKTQTKIRPQMVFDSAPNSDDPLQELSEMKEMVIHHPANNLLIELQKEETDNPLTSLTPTPFVPTSPPTLSPEPDSQCPTKPPAEELQHHSPTSCKSSESDHSPVSCKSPHKQSPPALKSLSQTESIEIQHPTPNPCASSLTDNAGNPDPKLLLQIYECIKQTRSTQNTPQPKKAKPMSSNRGGLRRRKSTKSVLPKDKKPLRKTNQRGVRRINRLKPRKRSSRGNDTKTRSLKTKRVTSKRPSAPHVNKKEERKSDDTLSVEHRLIKLKDTSSKLQQRLESIANTLSIPQTATFAEDRATSFNVAADREESGRDLVHTRLPYDVITQHPNFIEPISYPEERSVEERQQDLDRMSTMFVELERQIANESEAPFDYASSLRHSDPSHHNAIFNIYTKDTMHEFMEDDDPKCDQQLNYNVVDRNAADVFNQQICQCDDDEDERRLTDHELVAMLNGCVDYDDSQSDVNYEHSEHQNIQNSEERQTNDTVSKTLSATESYTMSMTPQSLNSNTKDESFKEVEAQATDRNNGSNEAQTITNKLLLELELLGSMQHTASKLDKFEMDTVMEQQQEQEMEDAHNQQTDDEISDLKKAKDELMTTLNRVKADIDFMEQQKMKNERLADEHIDLIKKTGDEMTKLISQTQQHLTSEHEQKHLELLKLSTNILSDHQYQTDKEKQELQQTLNIAMKLLDQYAHNLQHNQERAQPPDDMKLVKQYKDESAQDLEKRDTEITPNAAQSGTESEDKLTSLNTTDRLLNELNANKVSMLDRMLNDLKEERLDSHQRDDDGPSSFSKCKVSSNEHGEAQIAGTETTAYSEFANEVEDEYSDDAFDALTNMKSPKSIHETSGLGDHCSGSSTTTEIDFDEEDDVEDSVDRTKESQSQSEPQNEIISVSESVEQRTAPNEIEEIVSVITSATEISFDVESTVIDDDTHREDDGEERMVNDEIEDIATESDSEIETEIDSEIITEIESSITVKDEASVEDEEESAEREIEDDYDEVDTEIMSIENAEALSTITSTLSSLIPIQSPLKPLIDEDVNDIDGDEDVDDIRKDDQRQSKSGIANAVETADSYESSLNRMDDLSIDDKLSTDSFSDTVSSILSESLSFLESSIKESGENGITPIKEEKWDELNDEEDIDGFQTESDELEKVNSKSDETVDNEEEDHPAIDQETADALSLDLISEFVTDLFEETSALYELRLNRSSILSRQSQIERTLDESVGIFSSKTDESDVGVEASSGYIESYIEHILSHCDEKDWASKDPMNIDFSVFIYVETEGNRKEKQQIFNNLIFDTLNEALAEFKCNEMRTLKSTKRQLVRSVKERMEKLVICQTPKDLKARFGDDQDIDDRIRMISNEWMLDFERSHEWKSSFPDFKREIKIRIADLIFEQMLTDIVCELNQIERNRDER